MSDDKPIDLYLVVSPDGSETIVRKKRGRSGAMHSVFVCSRHDADRHKMTYNVQQPDGSYKPHNAGGKVKKKKRPRVRSGRRSLGDIVAEIYPTPGSRR